MNGLNSRIEDLRGLAGHLLDLYDSARMDFKNPRSVTKLRVLKKIGRLTGARTLVETGTFHGVTTRRAARSFPRVVTIELEPVLAASAARNLASYPNVFCKEGNAVDVLPEVLTDEANTDVLVFLDGHYSGPGTALGPEAEPAIAELEILARFKTKIKGVVVDDFRTFGTERGHPRKSDLLRTAEDLFEGYVIRVEHDQLIVARLN